MTMTAPMPAPIERAISLTRRGEAVVAMIRLRRQLVGLDVADRAYVAELLHDLAHDVEPTTN